jgi:hypothetical protein
MHVASYFLFISSSLLIAAETTPRQLPHHQVDKISKDIGADRREVIDWLKQQPPPPPPGLRSEQPLPAAARDVDAGRESDDGWGEASCRPPAPSRRGSQSSSSSFPSTAPRVFKEGGPEHVPFWKRQQLQRGTKITRQAESTLEMVFSKTRWPSDEVVESMYELHKLRKDVVVGWFRSRREEEKGLGRGGGGGRSSGGDRDEDIDSWKS